MNEISDWMTTHVADLFGGPASVLVDPEEITVVGPLPTRLRQGERRVLDTLVAGGVARSRSDALAWCVRLVGEHEGDWIARLREALRSVDEARATGPATS